VEITLEEVFSSSSPADRVWLAHVMPSLINCQMTILIKSAQAAKGRKRSELGKKADHSQE